MRRNAESLLRLAGGGDTTQAGWGGPVPVVDVVRGALGEVEDYQRVDVRALQPATVSGAAGADLAHALAELVENALHFSPPHERVEVRGPAQRRDGYTLAIIDQGVGMNEEQLETANRRLAGEESFTVAPSRYLGHYVAGHLAATHGIEIAPDVDGRRRRHRPHRRAQLRSSSTGPPASATSPSSVHEHVDLSDDLGEAPGADEPILEDLRPERPPLAPGPSRSSRHRPSPTARRRRRRARRRCARADPVAEAPTAPPLGGAGRLAVPAAPVRPVRAPQRPGARPRSGRRPARRPSCRPSVDARPPTAPPAG